jgi:hypothetical protein
MLKPSATNPLPWHKHRIAAWSFRDGEMTIWAVDDANGNEVFRLDNVDPAAEQTADFIVAMANVSTCVVWMEVDSERARLRVTS